MSQYEKIEIWKINGRTGVLSIREKCAKYEKLTFLLIKLSNSGLRHWTGNGPINTMRWKNFEIRPILGVSVAVDLTETLFEKYHGNGIEISGFFVPKFTSEWRAKKQMWENHDFKENGGGGAFLKSSKNYTCHNFFIFENLDEIFSPFPQNNCLPLAGAKNPIEIGKETP